MRVREFYIAMQRCPYIHEMKERLLGAPLEGTEHKDSSEPARERTVNQAVEPQVGTIVKVSSYLILSPPTALNKLKLPIKPFKAVFTAL